MAAIPPSWRRWAAALALVTLATLALGAGARALGTARARLFLPTGSAEWIWARLPRDDSSPLAFYAVHDFTLDSLPAGARLLAQAEEEYVLYLNGKRVGSGVYAAGAPLDSYDVAPLLRVGGNRLLVELRSGRGWGGFLARLEDGAGEPLATTGPEWRIFRRHDPGLLRGRLPLGEGDGGEPAFSWGQPPAGRWGLPEPAATPAAPVVSPLSFAPAAVAGPAAAPAPLPPVARQGRGPRVTFDWGREVEGYLVLDLVPQKIVAVGLLRTADGSRETAPVLVVPGAGRWIDARPRRFRRAEVLGLVGVLGARVLPAPGRATPLPAPPRGVLGITPPPLRTPVEEKVRRELERVPGLARGEDF